MSYAVVTPAYHDHFWRVLRLAKSIRDKVTDVDNFKFFVVTTDDREMETLRSQLNAYVPGSTAIVVSYHHVLKDLRFNAGTEIFNNIHRRQLFHLNYQSMKKLCATVYADADQVFLLDADAYVYREMSIWDDVIKPYLDCPQHFSYVSQQPLLGTLRTGAAHVLHYNHNALLAYNYEYQNWVLEKDLLTNFLNHIRDSWGCSNYFDAIQRAVFSATSPDTAFLAMMAYRYWLEQTQVSGTVPRLAKYEFLDSYDAIAQSMPEAVLAASKPAEHPIEHLANWITPATFNDLQNFVRTFRLCLTRLDVTYKHPWLIRRFIQETPELKMFVCSPDYDLFV